MNSGLLHLFGCSFTCAYVFTYSAGLCALKHDPNTEPEGFVDCLIADAQSSNCGGCICEYVCHYYYQYFKKDPTVACNICRASKEPSLMKFEAIKGRDISITNNMDQNVFIWASFYYDVCDRHSVSISPNSSFTFPTLDNCGETMKVQAEIEFSTTICTPKDVSFPTELNFFVDKSSSSGCIVNQS